MYVIVYYRLEFVIYCCHYLYYAFNWIIEHIIILPYDQLTMSFYCHF